MAARVTLQACGTNADWPDGHADDAHTKEVLRFERELLQLEQEELRRQRENLLRDQNRIIQKSVQDISTVPNTSEKPPLHSRKTVNPNYRHSMPNLLINESYTPVVPSIPERPVFNENMKRKPFVSEEHIQRHFGIEESRKVLYEDRKIGEAVRRQVPSVRPPQPVLPPKPKTRESIEREITMRSSRVPSAVEYVNVDRAAVQLRQKANGQYHPMTRHTLQALSAAPTQKVISNAEWLQARQPPPRKPANYNYNQHWLIQEAEQRRIEEQRLKIRVSQRHSYHQDMAPPLHHGHQLSSSQQHLSEFKRPSRLDRPEIPRPDMPRAEILRTEISRQELTRPEIPRPDLPRSEILRPDLPRPEIPRPDLPRSEISRPELPRPEIPRPDLPRELPREAPRSEVSRSELSRTEASHEDKMLSVSGRRKCSHCGEELGRGAAMIIESLSLCYHVWCFTCAVCGARLGDGRAGADVRVRGNRLHCHHCYSGDDGRKYSRV